MAQVPSYVRELLMLAFCVVRCLCVLFWVCSSLHVCALLSVATGIGAAAPDGSGEMNTSRQNSQDSRGDTPHKRVVKRRHFMVLFNQLESDRV